MPWTPTAYHAKNLFILTVEGRYGPDWQRIVGGEAIARVAEEVARGFGGRADDPAADQGLTAQCLWVLPDGSRVCTGPLGLSLPADAVASGAA